MPKLSWEKMYIVVDAEGYPTTEHTQVRDAVRAKNKLVKETGKEHHVAQLVLVPDGKEDPTAKPELLLEKARADPRNPFKEYEDNHRQFSE